MASAGEEPLCVPGGHSLSEGDDLGGFIAPSVLDRTAVDEVPAAPDDSIPDLPGVPIVRRERLIERSVPLLGLREGLAPLAVPGDVGALSYRLIPIEAQRKEMRREDK